jgi:tRNA threonylcarbamoyladenosine biosynthesis protein TsaB
MKILAAQTTGASFSVSLNMDKKIIASAYYDCGLTHSKQLLAQIERILKDTNTSLESIDKFAVSKGPGSFTGIRVGMTVIKTLGQCLNKPIVELDSLQILQASMPEIKGIKVIAMIDALRDEVYIKRKDKIVIEKVNKIAKSMQKHKNKILIIGDAVISYRAIFEKYLGAYSVSLPLIFHTPKAAVLAQAAYELQGKDYSKISPLYVRPSWAQEQKNKINNQKKISK